LFRYFVFIDLIAVLAELDSKQLPLVILCIHGQANWNPGVVNC